MPDIGFADLVKAWDALGRRVEVVDGLARVLGLSQAAVMTVSPTSAPQSLDAVVAMATAELRVMADVHVAEREVSASPTTSEIRLVPQAPVTVGLPRWSDAEPLARSETTAEAPPLDPLFVPSRERAILGLAAKRMRAQGALDEDAVVDAFARHTSLKRLPRRTVASLTGGVALILDRSHWMSPYSEDVARLSPRLREVAGEVVEYWITDIPPLVAIPRGKPAPWQSPPPGTAILIASDLGRAAARRGYSGAEAAWFEFLRGLSEAESDPIVFVPGDVTHYREMANAFRRVLVLGWDRMTRIGDISRFLKERR
jgi:hypothetical protein